MRYTCDIARDSLADVAVVGGGTAGVFAALAAALAADQNRAVTEIAYAELCRALEAIGGIVPKQI